MLSAAEGILLSIATVEAGLGVLGNTFIALVNCMDWAKNNKLSMTGFLLIGLATSRIFIVWLLTLDAYAKLFYPSKYFSSSLIEIISYIWMTVNHLTVWFATSLSIFYFLKIANFSDCVFLWLKRRTDKAFVFLLGCLLTSWVISFSFVVKVMKDGKVNHRNRTSEMYWEKRQFTINYVFLNIGVISLFMMTLTACFLLIMSLWRHSRQMQSGVSGFRDLNTEAHVKAIKFLISFIILFVLYFIGVSIEIICIFIPENKLLFIFGFTTASIYPCCHSFILILSNSQLKQAFVKVLQGLKFF
ncbi:taste receptor type 2 member 105 [Mus musculus]|jgi:taste receptor type 2|uniref:Taste receptor type 2 member 105 n=2 Tax=Mus musculus TaxID=10090 RepID=TR105_MOUSE|nr:taste receptor type 2 member 105 [Mus musculus]Q9JKT4.1 RecName: Full=Taste receptor type 2 member 105; Short=T2R105; AltName: Full=Taste receptor type 2 member 5; Short=T2R5; AltName: Full=Taste receptor type 2 member 9; Short=T2R9 [Mus musculus]AAF43920.1 candidate taste receptor T2R5 [Mus musculus]AAI25516.1 Taste receptor, type 2, member 105 [Mus musculus]AAI25542.1 Taste receptor, type 2, member 105 [Mus musculus]AAQ93082.1 taste receptor T2R5 [Mus musculus]|eukprot:NP_065247.1 taste receptor type 2 member 105 [Mus musculus]